MNWPALTRYEGARICCNPEIWGGIECSYTRVRDTYGDQLDFCGHYVRGIEDIELIIQLGIKSLRYPLLWERYGSLADDDPSWKTVERELSMLRSSGIKIILGLVHHGSGPDYATLDESNFPIELEKFANCVARKFPWVEYYSPVNEPLTTARFCGLYGFWYPHKKSAESFAEILLKEIKGVVLSMKAIRAVNPSAKLIQTEDLAKTYSTKTMQYQADFENERRWLTFDLLCGSVKPGHVMWNYLRWVGISESSLQFFIENPCAPDILGLDYYITSERFLDEDTSKYPIALHGTNGSHTYVDIEMVRVRHEEPRGPAVLIQECWDRYKIPIAITEVHIHGTPDDQIRWFNFMWESCLKLNESGVDIRAVTAWAIFGSHGWSKILTEPPGEYERGVFDVSNGQPMSTRYTQYLKSLILNPNITNAALAEKGWWEAGDRYLCEDNAVINLL